MSYFIRYVITDDAPITLEDLDAVLQEIDANYMVDEDVIVFGDEEYGQITIDSAGAEPFTSDIKLLEEFATEKDHKDKLLPILQAAKIMVTIQVLGLGYRPNALEVLQPLLDWLLANRPGLLADEGGIFYNQNGLLP